MVQATPYAHTVFLCHVCAEHNASRAPKLAMSVEEALGLALECLNSTLNRSYTNAAIRETAAQVIATHRASLRDSIAPRRVDALSQLLDDLRATYHGEYKTGTRSAVAHRVAVCQSIAMLAAIVNASKCASHTERTRGEK